MLFTLTGSPTVTTPCSLTILGWWNCPMMAASCRNLTFSSSEASGRSVLIATSTGPSGESHTPLSTRPNCPDPRGHVVLWSLKHLNYFEGFGVMLLLDTLPDDLPVPLLCQLLIDTGSILPGCPVNIILSKEVLQGWWHVLQQGNCIIFACEVKKYFKIMTVHNKYL